MSRRLVPLKEAPANGIPMTLEALNWVSFHREYNGAQKAGALVKCGRGIFVDPERFLDWMASNPRISPPVPKAAKRSPARVTKRTSGDRHNQSQAV